VKGRPKLFPRGELLHAGDGIVFGKKNTHQEGALRKGAGESYVICFAEKCFVGLFSKRFGRLGLSKEEVLF